MMIIIVHMAWVTGSSVPMILAKDGIQRGRISPKCAESVLMNSEKWKHVFTYLQLNSVHRGLEIWEILSLHLAPFTGDNSHYAYTSSWSSHVAVWNIPSITHHRPVRQAQEPICHQDYRTFPGMEFGITNRLLPMPQFCYLHCRASSENTICLNRERANIHRWSFSFPY